MNLKVSAILELQNWNAVQLHFHHRAVPIVVTYEVKWRVPKTKHLVPACKIQPYSISKSCSCRKSERKRSVMTRYYCLSVIRTVRSKLQLKFIKISGQSTFHLIDLVLMFSEKNRPSISNECLLSTSREDFLVMFISLTFTFWLYWFMLAVLMEKQKFLQWL